MTLVINTLYEQKKKMYDSLSHNIEDSIVRTHQLHMRPIVQGKNQAKVEWLNNVTNDKANRISFKTAINKTL